MIHSIENEHLRISVNDHGGELCSIYDKEKNREILWQADPAFWKRHAPVLFPNVGRHYGDHYCIEGKEYTSKQHGFARDSEFVCIDKTFDSLTHQLKATDETREKYPFDFELRVKHILRDRDVIVCWKVMNYDNKEMYFTIGGHPAFNVPVDGQGVQSDYILTFDGQDSLSYLLIDPESGTAMADTLHTLELENGTCRIDAHMFDNDALIFDHQINKAGIAMPDGTPYLEVSCKGFPNFGIWSVPGAPFVCLEPWMGRCDDCGFNGELSQKNDINELLAGEIFESEYRIKIF